jgi:hypothetical protein
MGASLGQQTTNVNCQGPGRLACLAPDRVRPSYFCRIVGIKGSQDIKWKSWLTDVVSQNFISLVVISAKQGVKVRDESTYELLS